jgi:hypothetical protein
MQNNCNIIISNYRNIRTGVFIIPVPWVLIELAMCRMLMVLRCLLLLDCSTKIWLLRLYRYLETKIWIFRIISKTSKPCKNIYNLCLQQTRNTTIYPVLHISLCPTCGIPVVTLSQWTAVPPYPQVTWSKAYHSYVKPWIIPNTIYKCNTVGHRFTNIPVHEQFGSRTHFSEQKASRMTKGFSDYEHASWQQRQADSISAGVSVAG